eukprot:6127348-Amphidinium_carterae.1
MDKYLLEYGSVVVLRGSCGASCYTPLDHLAGLQKDGLSQVLRWAAEHEAVPGQHIGAIALIHYRLQARLVAGRSSVIIYIGVTSVTRVGQVGCHSHCIGALRCLAPVAAIRRTILLHQSFLLPIVVRCKQ